jgi:hypothetical protein
VSMVSIQISGALVVNAIFAKAFVIGILIGDVLF